mgnify:CR=1 FL=1
MNKDYKDKYTKPRLREKIKDDIKNSNKGGKKGKWSARKSQLLVQEYEKKGGGYKQDQNNKEASSLKEWTDQEWQTKEQEGKARKDGVMRRYLPKKVWDNLSEKDKKEAEKLKVEADKKGKHKVKWTPAIKKAFEKAGYSDENEQKNKLDIHKKAKELNIKGRSKMSKKKLKKEVKKAYKEQLGDQSKKELYKKAKSLDIENRSKLDKKSMQKKILDVEFE